MARPREFDRRAALRTAMELFWRRGYEGVSVADLTAALNISPPSLYAAFGNKADLYREVIDVYKDRPRAVSAQILEEDCPLKDAVRGLLYSAIRTVTELSPSHGCMISNGLLAVGPEHSDLAEITATLRRGLVSALLARFERARKEGEISLETSPRSLARYFSAIIQGISIQAHDGASKNELEGIIELSLDALPERRRAKKVQ